MPSKYTKEISRSVFGPIRVHDLVNKIQMRPVTLFFVVEIVLVLPLTRHRSLLVLGGCIMECWCRDSY